MHYDSPRHTRSAGLDPYREHDACGVGFVARATGERSHEVVRLALQALARVAHRGAASTDNSGDGAGLLTQIPYRLFHREAYRLGLRIQPGQPFAVGVFFLPADSDGLRRARCTDRSGLRRERPAVPGLARGAGGARRARTDGTGKLPRHPPGLRGQAGRGGDDEAWERVLYLARRDIERRQGSWAIREFYVCSLSCRTVVYKALLVGTQLAAFYTDFRYPEFETAIAVFHQRYSTNTLPSWPLAQPFRMIAHNGEINTLWGNRNAMTAREAELGSPVWGTDIDRLQAGDLARRQRLGRVRQHHGAAGALRAARRCTPS